jgi:Protein of unknown function (DUF4058)
MLKSRERFMQAKSIKNQYRGVNAHLHSFLQGIGRWSRLHNVHVADLMKLLKAQLRPIGYTAEIEESMQIRRVWENPVRPKADVLLADLDPLRAPRPSSISSADAQIMTLDELIENEIDQEHPYSAIEIRPLVEDDEPGEPVGWLELLSPSNKGGSIDAQAYRAKRTELLRSGLVFVELDYLHETPPTFWRFPDYAYHEPNAHPYQIIVLDPRPTFREGKAYRYPFDVDAPIPKVDIPLNAGDLLTFDFGEAYRKTFEEGIYGDRLNYAHLPMNFDRYSEADQGRIAARMLSVLEARHDGIDLETGPFPFKPLPLAEALAQITAIKNANVS